MNRLNRTSSSNFASSIIRSAAAAALAVSALGSIGCIPFGDPEQPGASGTISLAEGITTEGFATLHLRAAPFAPFDSAAPSFPASGGEGSDWRAWTTDLSVITFPHAYDIHSGGPTTPSERWNLFVWLSASGDESDSQPASGEPFGRATFMLNDCGSFGDYCAVTEGVNITIDQTAP